LEDIIGYIVIFVAGLGALYLFQWRKDRIRLFPLSEQFYAELVLTVLIRKQGSEVKSIIVRVQPKKETIIQDIRVELLHHENEPFSFSLNEITGKHKLPVKILQGNSFDFEFEMEPFKDEITARSVKFNVFRLAAQTQKGKKFKSHRLAFDKRWSVFKPDTGRYN